MNFDDDIREQVLNHLPCEAADRPHLEACSASNLLIIYLNWLGRLVAPQPRRLHESKALKSNLLATGREYGAALNHIRRLIDGGGDLEPHLSRSVRIGYQHQAPGTKKLAKRRDLDLLLNDWGVHHLHLSCELEADGFVKRTEPLLFAVFHTSDAYLVNILPHGNWVDEELIRIIVNEWPEAGIVYELKGILPSQTWPSQVERKRLRNVAMNVALTIDNKVYWPAAGLTSAGTGLRTTTLAQHILRALDAFEKRHTQEPEWLAEVMIGAGLIPPDQFMLKFAFLDDGYGVLDSNSGTVFRLQ